MPDKQLLLFYEYILNKYVYWKLYGNHQVGMNFMKTEMEQMISKDLGIEIKQIRNASWEKLEKSPKKIGEKPFRPKNMFIVGGNINLAEKREMGKIGIELRNTYRKAAYKVKCLLASRKNV